MVRTIKRFSWLAVLVLNLPDAGAFALLGPNNEAYQAPVIGYNPNPNFDGQTIAPKNIGEEYRRNTPVLYYAFDQNFLDYFGSNGVVAIDAAFQVFNGLANSNLSSFSPDLSEFPLEASRVNFQAQALGMTDLKSTAMTVIIEQMGLTHPDRYVWTLHGRELIGPGPCPANMNYTVIKRNFDPVFSAPDQLQSSSYVNGTLYTYRVVEFCDLQTSPVDPLLADATEFQVDPLATTFTAIAAGNVAPILYGGTAFDSLSGLLAGYFYTGLTRDDIGGLRYLMRTNNMNIEAAGPDTETFITNTVPQLLFTSNLTEFAVMALTNGPGALAALFPNLQIVSSSPIFTNVVTTSTIFYFTNSPFTSGTAILASNVVRTTNILIYWNHQFLNVYITPNNQIVSNSQIPIVPGHSAATRGVTIWTTNIGSCGPFQSGTLVCTNVSSVTVTTNGVFGDYYILPTNLCAVSIVSTQLITPITITNGTFVATNAPGTTNVGVQSFSQTATYTFNQYAYVVLPVVCPTNSVALRQGIESIRYERRDYDSLLNQFWPPVTNTYTLNAITNGVVRPQTVRRSVFVPDMLFTAADLATGPGTIALSSLARSITFDQNNALQNLAGPGTVVGPTVVTFNKVGVVYSHIYPLLGEDTAVPNLIWGSFDGSTNAPIIYPNGSSIMDLENQVLIQITPGGPALPDASVGLDYTTQFTGFTVNGGTPPYAWSLGAGSALPPGLVLNPVTGVISGEPTDADIYDFVLRLTDAGTRYVERPYTIIVNP